jgi:hypothetical protein
MKSDEKDKIPDKMKGIESGQARINEKEVFKKGLSWCDCRRIRI